MRRTLVGLVVAALVGIGAVVAPPASAEAAVATYPVMNTSETLPDGVWFRNSPVQNDTNRETNFGVLAGESMAVDCFSWGEAVGPYANHIWYRGLDASRPTINGHSNYGWMNTHYVNDGQTADRAAPGVPDCAASAPVPDPSPTTQPGPPTPSVIPCTFNMRWNKTNLTVSYPGKQPSTRAAQWAVNSWNALGYPLQLTWTTDSRNANIVFTDIKSTAKGYGFGGQAQVPSSWIYDPNTGRPYTYHRDSYNTPTRIVVLVNQAYLPQLSSFQQNLVLTHELGHAFGLAHTDECGFDSDSIMRKGPGLLSKAYNTPMPYDKANLAELYGFALR